MIELKGFLDRLLETYHRPELLGSDPLEFVHRYEDPWDQEAVALFSALLAYGNVRQIKRSVEDLLSRMERSSGSPAHFARAAAVDPQAAARALRGFVHRFNVGKDLAILSALLGRSWATYGSLGAHFLKHHAPDDPDISGALDRLIDDWGQEIIADPELSKMGRASPSFSYFLTAPEDGSCCKRWCMFLRWMGRKDALDPGLWRSESPLARTFPQGRHLASSKLILPLDTHTGRISQYLGLTARKSLGWLAALEITERLRESDPLDPTKYDFALSRLGILDMCRHRFDVRICPRCELFGACRFTQSTGLREKSAQRGSTRLPRRSGPRSPAR